MIACFILTLAMGLMVLGVMAENNMVRDDQALKAQRIMELKLELWECQQMNMQSSRLLKNEIISIKLK